jgi:hypothetical protein
MLSAVAEALARAVLIRELDKAIARVFIGAIAGERATTPRLFAT